MDNTSIAKDSLTGENITDLFDHNFEGALFVFEFRALCLLGRCSTA
jgi:hypothetical protein